LSAAVPFSGVDVDVVEYVDALVGPAIVIVGKVVSDVGAVATVHVKD